MDLHDRLCLLRTEGVESQDLGNEGEEGFSDFEVSVDGEGVDLLYLEGEGGGVG